MLVAIGTARIVKPNMPRAPRFAFVGEVPQVPPKLIVMKRSAIAPRWFNAFLNKRRST